MTAGARVLVVDDVEANRAILIRRLARLGVSGIVEAVDGRAALDRIAGQPFDLVLLDIMMPVMNGFEVLEKLGEAVTSRAAPPVIVISALSEMESVVRAVRLGAEDFLLKPFEPALLRARVLATLEKKVLRDRIALELERKRAELAEARGLQLALTPPPLADDGLRIAAVLEPAREIGGDLVDHLPLSDGRHLLLVGDVSDKGAAAALVMARTHALFRSFASRWELNPAACDLAGLAHAMNGALCANNASCMFVTAVLCLHDPATGQLEFVRCGHVPPFVRRARGDVERLDLPNGLPLGVDDGMRYHAGSDTLGVGDLLLLVSDGVTEAESPDGTPFADAGVLSWLDGGDGDVQGLVRAVRAHENGAPPSDDVAVLAMHVDRTGQGEQPGG